MTRLLCATDLLPKSEPAMDRAGLLAQELGADLSILHVVSPTASDLVLEDSLQVAMTRMKSRVRGPQWRHGPSPDVLLRTGKPARRIREAVDLERPDLLILGPHERANVLEGVTGTIAEKVLGARKCPLLLVQASADVSYDKVLLALDLSTEAGLAVRAAESLVLRPESRAMAMHVSEPPLRGMLPSAHREWAGMALQRQARSDLYDLLHRESVDRLRYEVLIEEGYPIPAILRAVEIHRPQLLVIGTRAIGRMRRAVLGSVAAQLLKQIVSCDVLVVPSGIDNVTARACGG